MMDTNEREENSAMRYLCELFTKGRKQNKAIDKMLASNKQHTIHSKRGTD
jgi:hypothetical protein